VWRAGAWEGPCSSPILSLVKLHFGAFSFTFTVCCVNLLQSKTLNIKGCFLSLPVLKQIADWTPKGAFGVKMGDDRTYRPIDLKGMYPQPNTYFGALGAELHLSG